MSLQLSNQQLMSARRFFPDFKPQASVGGVLVGESQGKVAVYITELEMAFIVTALPVVLGAISWVIFAYIWWWGASSLKFKDGSKFIGLISPILGIVAEVISK